MTTTTPTKRRPKGTGTLRQRRPGVWQVRASVGVDGHGHPIQVSQTVHGTKRDAQAVLNKLLVDAAEQEAPLTGAATVAMLLDRWLQHVTPMREPETIRGYRVGVRRIKERSTLGSIRVSKLTAQHLDATYRRWLSEGLSPTTIRNTHVVLGVALHQAERWGLIRRAATDLADVPTARAREVEAVPADDVRRLITAAEAKQQPILAVAIALAALTGCRRGELCGLRWSDINWNDSTLLVHTAIKYELKESTQHSRSLRAGETKTHQVRRLALDEGALAILTRHRQHAEDWAKQAGCAIRADGYILSYGADGSDPVRPDTLTQGFNRLRDELGLTLRFHDLRHFAATQMLGANIDPRTVAGRLGHRDPSVTMRVYAAFLEQQDRRAAEVLGRLVVGELPPASMHS